MTLRILHSSDWHLGQYFYGKSRASEHQQFLSWLLEQVSTHNIDAVIVAGDIFDTGTPPSYAREMYFDFVLKMHQLNCPLIILAGNHDSVAMLGESKQLLSKLSCQVITHAQGESIEQIIVLKDKHNNPQGVICAIPYLRPRDVTSSIAGQSSEQKQQALQQAISEHYQTLFEQAKTLANQQIPIIATGHLTTVGVTSSESVRDIYIGTLEAFPANAFPKADYIALGHIHRSQKVAKSDHIRYCGSPIPLSFDEVNQDKHVLLVEFEKAKFSNVTELVVPRFQPMAMVKTSLLSLTADIESLLSETDYADKKLWLDIEIDSADYLADISHKVIEATVHYPVEVLLTRRSKKSRR